MRSRPRSGAYPFLHVEAVWALLRRFADTFGVRRRSAMLPAVRRFRRKRRHRIERLAKRLLAAGRNGLCSRREDSCRIRGQRTRAACRHRDNCRDRFTRHRSTFSWSYVARANPTPNGGIGLLPESPTTCLPHPIRRKIRSGFKIFPFADIRAFVPEPSRSREVARAPKGGRSYESKQLSRFSRSVRRRSSLCRQTPRP